MFASILGKKSSVEMFKPFHSNLIDPIRDLQSKRSFACTSDTSSDTSSDSSNSSWPYEFAQNLGMLIPNSSVRMVREVISFSSFKKQHLWVESFESSIKHHQHQASQTSILDRWILPKKMWGLMNRSWWNVSHRFTMWNHLKAHFWSSS